jgi:hypothetical protein
MNVFFWSESYRRRASRVIGNVVEAKSAAVSIMHGVKVLVRWMRADTGGGAETQQRRELARLVTIR